MQLRKSLGSITTLSLAAITVNVQSADAAYFQGLGYLPGLDTGSRAFDILADGNIVVGTSQ
ncbi:hypothetical protein Lepto7375DRAFT_7325 [Leptolyngbya sp. PCC 7375]|nr:hypothetical protein Lepto7375DRAFT_7325 [Leptolyngbya sp. PCC 7375]